MVTDVATAASHDLIEIDGRRVGDPPRKGRVLEVIGRPDHVHYRVRWDDGHESMFYPGGDSRIRVAAPARGLGTAAPVVELLRDAGVEFEVLRHRRTTSAEGEARALGVLPQETAKTVVARAAGGCVRVVVPASRRVDLEKLRKVVETDATVLSEEELGGAYPEFELGAVPPFGGPAGDRVVVDGSLEECDYVVLEAGAHDVSIRLRAADLVRLTDAAVAAVAA